MTPTTTGSKVDKIDQEIAKLLSQRASAAADDLIPLRKEYLSVVERITKSVQQYGLTASQFLAMDIEAVRRHIESGAQAASPAPRPRVPPKYRHPENKDLTWTGRGNKPLWVVSYLDDGGDLETLLIDKSKGKVGPKVQIPAKYRNPENVAETWTGRGAKPRWVRDYLDEGNDLDSIRIDGPAIPDPKVVKIPLAGRGRGVKAAKRKQGGRRAKKR